MRISRRQILLGLVGMACTARAAQVAGVQKRRYRVDAAISLLGANLITQQNVGSAFVSLHETEESERRIVRLQFAGGSDSERAHGIVYAGSLEESVVEHCSECLGASYFGFVSEPEEPADPFRRAAFERGKFSSFKAVQGHHESGCARRTWASVVLGNQTWKDMPDLIAQVRSRFVSINVAGADVPYPGAVPATFLYATLAAIRSGELHFERPYIHNGRPYRLECDKARDPKGAWRLTGRIHSESTKRTSQFRVWLDATSDLPTRIEFQPRSYLRITLEKEES